MKKIECVLHGDRRYTRYSRNEGNMSETKEQQEKLEDEKEIEEAMVAASLLHPKYSREWYLELDKCPALQRQQAAFWKKYGSSKGW